MTLKFRDPLYRRHRFPGEVIAHAVWLYFRFPLSLRMVEAMLAARGIIVTHQTIRLWAENLAGNLPTTFAVVPLVGSAINGIWTRVCREAPTAMWGPSCMEDERLVPRSRPSGVGFKPLQAATVKSRGGERCRKGGR